MADNETRALVIIEADKASAAATQRALANVSADVKNLGKSSATASVGASDLQKELGKIARADHLKGIATEMGLVASKTKDVGTAVVDLEKKLKRLGATDDEIKGLASTFQNAANTPDAVPEGRGVGARLTKAGASIRNLPSVQIPGLGIGTDAVGNLLRVSGAIKEFSDKAKAASAVTAATSAVTVAASGAQSAANTTVAATSVSAAGGALTLAVALGPIAALGVAIGVAVTAAFVLIKGATDAFSASAQANADKVTRAYEATDSVFDSILAGDTSEEARKKIAQEQLKIDQANKEASAAFQQEQQRFAEIASKWGTAAAEIAKNRGTDEFPLFAERMAEQRKISADATAKIEEYNQALKDNRFAAGDAAEAEKKRQEEEEKAAREAEQRAKDIEAAEQRIADARSKNTERIEDNARQAGQRLEDIERSTQDKRADASRKYSDDLANIALKARRENIDAAQKIAQQEADAALKIRQEEADALLNQQRTLQDIRKNALRDETDQLRQRNFLGATLASEAAQDAVSDANETAKREAEDRIKQQEREAAERETNYQREAAERYQNQQRARIDRATAFQQEQRDAVTAYQRQLRDAEIARYRQEESTRIAYDREIEQLTAHLNEKLALEAQEQAAERLLKSGEQPLRNGNTTSNSNSNTNINDNRSLRIDLTGGGAAVLQDTIRRVTLDTMRQVRYR